MASTPPGRSLIRAGVLLEVISLSPSGPPILVPWLLLLVLVPQAHTVPSLSSARLYPKPAFTGLCGSFGFSRKWRDPDSNREYHDFQPR